MQEGQSSRVESSKVESTLQKPPPVGDPANPSSLLNLASFSSRYEKDLELGQSIMDQVAEVEPKGTLRAVSSTWMSKYSQFVSGLMQATTDEARAGLPRPSPIMNFDLLDLQPEYVSQLEVVFNYEDPQAWSSFFNNWEYMSVKEGLQLAKDFHLISLSNWIKLKKAFGGGPDIPFFQYSIDVEAKQADGTTQVIKEPRHDFNPIKVRTHILRRSRESSAQPLTLLVSQHLTHVQFKNYLTLVKSDIGTRLDMFIVRGEDQPAILEVSKERKTLHELGVREATSVVLFDCDVTAGLQSNKGELYHTIADLFNIPYQEYEGLVPQISAKNASNFFEAGSPVAARKNDFPKPSQPTFNQPSAVPPEYQNDPDLWYAIQASLGNEAVEPTLGKQTSIDSMMNIDEDIDYDSPEIARNNVSMNGGGSMHSTPKKRNKVGPIFDENEFGPSSQAPQVQESALVSKIDRQKKQMTRAEHAKQLRESRRAQFEAKRILAKQKMESTTCSSGTKNQLRGQLGQQLRQFSEVSGHMQKLRSCFDQLMKGEVTISEVYEQTDTELLAGGLLGMTPSKQQVAASKVFRGSIGSSGLGNDEIDCECRTEDDDEEHNRSFKNMEEDKEGL